MRTFSPPRFSPPAGCESSLVAEHGALEDFFYALLSFVLLDFREVSVCVLASVSAG